MRFTMTGGEWDLFQNHMESGELVGMSTAMGLSDPAPIPPAAADIGKVLPMDFMNGPPY